MRIAITGASGLIGRSLSASLAEQGCQLHPLVRRAPAPGSGEVPWDPKSGEIEAGRLEGVEAVVHLAGESIVSGRWTAARKAAIRASRVEGTGLLAETLAGLSAPPRVWVSASAVGYYGNRGEEALTEEGPPGAGFLAEVCQAWEAATGPAREAGVRVVNLRIGIVLARAGGVLRAMLPAFRLGLGGPLGDGRQYMSWIALSDLVRAIGHVMACEALHGPVNATTAEPVTNAEFAGALGSVLRRPARLRVPALALRAALGEMGESLLLGGQRVLPARLVGGGFRFAFPHLEEALRAELAPG